MAWDFGDEAQFVGENVTGYRYIAHLYCLAVQAGFYSDVVECSLSTRENLVRSPSGKKDFFFACYRIKADTKGSTITINMSICRKPFCSAVNL